MRSIRSRYWRIELFSESRLEISAARRAGEALAPYLCTATRACNRSANPGNAMLTRRHFVAASAACLVRPACAQSYPDRPIRLIVPSAPGGPTDIPARLLSQFLPRLGQPAVVETRPGAGGAIGARVVATAPADGYTLLIGNTSVLAVIPAVSASAGYDPAKHFAPVAKISESYQILVVPPSTPWKSVEEFVHD